MLNLDHLNAKCITFAKTNLSDLSVLIALIMPAFTRFLILQRKNETGNQIPSYSFYLLITGVIWKSIEYLMGQHKHENSSSTETLEPQI